MLPLQEDRPSHEYLPYTYHRQEGQEDEEDQEDKPYGQEGRVYLYSYPEARTPQQDAAGIIRRDIEEDRERGESTDSGIGVVAVYSSQGTLLFQMRCANEGTQVYWQSLYPVHLA